MSDSPDPSRFVIGIDLGTTNSALAFVDTLEHDWHVCDFPAPQLVAPSTVEPRDVLPSFHYDAAAGEFPVGALKLPWSAADPTYAVGAFARDHGAAVPGRLISSAKSWLCHPGVDRTAGLLPWHGAPDTQRLSPVEASARYLLHLRNSWDHAHPDHPLSEQDVILTVPASFDEVARELTVQAAVQAGLPHVVLVEEPQAAFYAWLHDHRDRWESQVTPGQKILVCDIGGGTSDFTLISVRRAADDKIQFHRIAVGDHLILGGDNLDLALAHHLERKISAASRLDPRRFATLVRLCRSAKETLLGATPPDKLTITLPGGGSRVIGGATQVPLTGDEAIQILVDGFLPRVPFDAKPAARRSGFQEFGLPYAPDPAITKYLAAFLLAHGGDDVVTARPDIVLFNGGFFESPTLTRRLLEVLGSWFTLRGSTEPWVPKVLPNPRLDLAVARGAAHYGMVRRGRAQRIAGGSAHTYYVGVESSAAAAPSAICLLPAGLEEGQSVDLNERPFNLLIRQPVEFPLYVSSVRTTDVPGDVFPIDPLQMTALPPIRTVLQSGRKSEAATVPVTLHARRTEIGTLDLWCAEASGSGDRTWRLQFDVRVATRPGQGTQEGGAEIEGVVDQQIVDACTLLIRQSFTKNAAGVTDRPEGLVKRLELATSQARTDWPASLMRSFWETLIDVADGRRLSPEHEIRWLNLAGFCLRPGYGLAVDDWRVAQAWKLQSQRVVHAKNEQCRAEWWVLWRRVAGGLTQGQQHTLAEPLLSTLRTYLRKAGTAKGSPLGYGPHEGAEVFRLLGALELLKIETKIELGDMLLPFIVRDRAASLRDAAAWALGRLGSRVPIYGPLNALVPADAVEAWLRKLLDGLSTLPDKLLFSFVQLARLTGDRYRDLSAEPRAELLSRMGAVKAPDHYLHLIRVGGELAADEQKIAFGESLPRGLRIE
jgi:molecular chaperone DnaK (HSP70)